MRLLDDLLGHPRPPSRRRRYDREYSLWTFVAPAALLVAVIVMVSLVREGMRSDPARATTTAQQATTGATASTATITTPRAVPRIYSVKPGDVLGRIADRFHVPLDKILQLNPNLNPQTLQPGQKIRLR